MEPSDKYLLKHKGCYFVQEAITPEYIDSLEDFEIRDSDIFLVTFPKSGTIWTQNILSLILHEGHRNATEDMDLLDRVPWLEYNVRNVDYINRPSPRLFATHLPYYLAPKGLKIKRGKVIYVIRNPKDVLVSYYHFSKVSVKLEVEDFEIFMERFLAGKESEKLCIENMQLPGGKLTEEELNDVVDKASFDKMSADSRTNYSTTPLDVLDFSKGRFMRKGTIGDWKNMMTVAQSERFDSVFKERMEKLPFKFCWGINDEL